MESLPRDCIILFIPSNDFLVESAPVDPISSRNRAGVPVPSDLGQSAFLTDPWGVERILDSPLEALAVTAFA